MTDDIVTRLRDWSIDDNSDACGRGEVDTCLRCEAADEIERLRNIIIGIAMNKQVWKGFNFE
jgi:hypothetical protein